MAYYCGECRVWVGSSDVDRYGRRWCSYSRKYEESNQNTYGCKGFVYNGRTVLTKVCNILNLSTEKWFEVFDAVKDSYVAPNHMDWLSNYCLLGPRIANNMEIDSEKHNIAKHVLHEYIQPAYTLWESGKSNESAKKYRDMILYLAEYYKCA